MKPSVLVSLSLIIAGSLYLGMVGVQSSAQGCPACPVSSSSPAISNTGTVKESSEATFNRDVLEAKQPVLVDFYATWCGPCKRMAPVMEALSKSYGRKIAVVRVDVDKNPGLSAQYGIQSIPAIKLFKNGTVIDETVGVTSVAELRGKLDRAL